jgi:hemoglobin
MNNMKIKDEITSINEIVLLVDSFYNKVKKDDLIGPIFDKVVQDNWPKHLDKMYRFWETVLLNNHTYHGSPFAPHAKLPISAGQTH